MNRTAGDTDHDRIDGLLPWYVNGTLDDEGRACVEAHVAGCGECRESLSLLQRVESAVNRDPATPLVPPPRPDRLLGRIDAAESRRRRWPWAAAAAIVVLAVLAAALPGRLGNDESLPAIYETATSVSGSGAIDYIVEIRFRTDAGAAARDDALREIAAGQSPVAGSDGSYRIVMSLDATTLTELEGAVGAVEARPEIESARVVAVQLPVE